MKTSEVGDVFEGIACKYLENDGYKVLFRNIYVGRDEIDIVCRQTSDGTLVFVEVKGLRKLKDFSPEINFSPEKVRKFSRATRMFAGKHPKLIGDKGYRLDLVAIELKTDTLRNWKEDCEIRYYKNVLA